MSQILDFYKNDALPAFGYSADEDGLISLVQPTGNQVPAKVDGRRLVVPTKEWLRKGFGEDYQAFHPLCESQARQGTSPVLQHMQRSLKQRLTYTVVALARGMIAVAADKSTHKDLPADCLDFLKKLAGADKNTVVLVDKLLAAAAEKGGKKNRLVTVYLKNGGTYEGKKVNRMAIIRFPLLEEVQDLSKDPLGIAIPKKQRPTIIALLKLLIPFGDNPEEYAAGTLARTAPYFTALVKAQNKIAKVLNQAINRYGIPLNMGVVPFHEIDDEKIEAFATMLSTGNIPTLRGNDGNVSETPEEASETKAVAPTAVVAENKVQQLTRNSCLEVPQPSTAISGKTVSMNDFMSAVNPQQQQQQVGFGMSFNNQFQQPNLLIPGQGVSFNTGTMGMGMNMGSTMPMVNTSSVAPSGLQLPWATQPQANFGMMNNPNPFMAVVQPANNGLGLV